MPGKYYMGVDLGTSFIKVGVFSETSECVSSAMVATRSERPEPGMFIQRGDDLFDSVCECIRTAAKQMGGEAQKIEAIAFTGQMAGSMGVDERWNDVTGWSCTLDGRYLPWADAQRKQFSEDMFNTGGTNAPVMSAKYAWFRDAFPEEHRRIAKYVMLNGYMIGRLSGISVEEACIDNSLITWTGMADIRGLRWSEKLCGEMGVDMAVLPRIVDCTEIGGYLSPDIARQLGLRSGIPLVAGAGDKVSGCVGAGILNAGDMIFEASSYGAISCLVPDVRLDPEKRNYDVIGSIDRDSYYVHKYIQGSGISLDWFVESFIREESVDRKRAMAIAEAEAAAVRPGSDRMIAIGLLGGSAMPFDSELRGLFMGHTWSHGRGHFYRALLECFSYDLALTLDSMCARYPQYADNEIKLIGGGAKSTIWPQMLADVTGHRFTTLSRNDVALWGAAMLAGKGVGGISDLRALARDSVSDERSYDPDPERYALYRPYVAMYETCATELHDLYARIGNLP